jgi:hypothetical protein
MRPHLLIAYPRRSIAAALAAVVVVVMGCRDTGPLAKAPVLHAPQGVQAQLVFSNPDPAPGEAVVVLVRILSGAEVHGIGSFTARISYDSTRLHLEGEAQLGDSAMRVLNPVTGEARIAGIATGGFSDGRLVALRFTALATQATKDMHVTFDELHAVDREDLKRVIEGPRAVDRGLLP